MPLRSPGWRFLSTLAAIGLLVKDYDFGRVTTHSGNFLEEIPDKAAGTNGLGVAINLAARRGWIEIVREHAATPVTVATVAAGASEIQAARGDGNCTMAGSASKLTYGSRLTRRVNSMKLPRRMLAQETRG